MQRKLSAILSADVVGYSRMMEADEAGTLQRLKDNRAKIFDPQVAAHDGRVFKLMGDGALAEFASVISAVNCALAIQEATESADTALPAAKRIRYRIGINLGEVIVEDDDIYGEGVNVAARLQSLAEPGGVALSRIVRDQVDGKTPVLFDDMGEHSVKNIERPVHVFSVRAAERKKPEARAVERSDKLSICVLPFANMSGDVEQEYFSDGISEDIITDLSKVSALSVLSRNASFMYKGKTVDIPKLARELKVTHVLEGSVRKSGGRVRITAQLISGASNDHVWAERYDRDLSDIFALQDEISEAIVKALKLKLVPEEKKAIENRGTNNAEAYNLYLMARQTYATGLEADPRRNETVIRLCKRAAEIDPNYARAWALLALAQMLVHASRASGGDEDGLAAADRALALDANLAEAHAVKARIFANRDRQAEAVAEIEIALRLDPESYEVNKAAALLSFRQRKFHDAIRYWTKAMALMENDFSSSGLLVTCYTALGDKEAAREAARITFQRAEKVLTQDRHNGAATGHGSIALAVLGQSERAKEWMDRALLVEPDNMDMRYNFACALSVHLKDTDAALAILGPVFEKVASDFINYAKVDPDLDPIRDDPRFKAMIAAAEARLAKDEGKPAG